MLKLVFESNVFKLYSNLSVTIEDGSLIMNDDVDIEKFKFKVDIDGFKNIDIDGFKHFGTIRFYFIKSESNPALYEVVFSVDTHRRNDVTDEITAFKNLALALEFSTSFAQSVLSNFNKGV